MNFLPVLAEGRMAWSQSLNSQSRLKTYLYNEHSLVED